MLIPPPTRISDRHSVHCRNILRCEESSQNISHYTSNSMKGKYIQPLVDMKNIFVLCHKKASERSHTTDDGSDVHRNISRGRSNPDQTSKLDTFMHVGMPAMTPEQAPMRDSLFLKMYSRISHVVPPPMAARFVLTTTYIDRMDRFAVLPPLNANHPHHIKHVPRVNMNGL